MSRDAPPTSRRCCAGRSRRSSRPPSSRARWRARSAARRAGRRRARGLGAVGDARPAQLAAPRRAAAAAWSAAPPPSASCSCARSASATAPARQSDNVLELAEHTLRDVGARGAARSLDARCDVIRRARPRRKETDAPHGRPARARRRGPDAAGPRAATRAAFEVVYERHTGAAFSLAYRMVGTPQRGRGRRAGGLPNLWRSGARYDRARGSRAHVGARHRPPPRDRRAAPRLRARPAARQRRGHRGALRGRRAHRRRGRPPRRGAAGPRGAGHAAAPSSARSSSSPTSAASRTPRSPRCSTRRSAPSRAGCGSAWRRCATGSRGGMTRG